MRPLRGGYATASSSAPAHSLMNDMLTTAHTAHVPLGVAVLIRVRWAVANSHARPLEPMEHYGQRGTRCVFDLHPSKHTAKSFLMRWKGIDHSFPRHELLASVRSHCPSQTLTGVRRGC
jgi:hypothetical protein